MTANRNEIHHNWKQRPKNQHQKTKPPIQSNQQNMRYIELRENLMKQVENKKSNFEETPPEILSVGWCRPSSTAPIAKAEAAQRRLSKPTFQKSIFFPYTILLTPETLWSDYATANRKSWDYKAKGEVNCGQQKKKVRMEMVKTSQGEVVVRDFLEVDHLEERETGSSLSATMRETDIWILFEGTKKRVD